MHLFLVFTLAAFTHTRRRLVHLFGLCLVCTTSFASPLVTNDLAAAKPANALDQQQLLQLGASLYATRCIGCHGKSGYGDGLMSMRQADYPSTNLNEARYGSDLESVKQTVKWGGAQGNMSQYSPPWIYELTEVEVDAVSQFVLLLRNDNLVGKQKVMAVLEQQPANQRHGKLIYASYCLLCHGRQGKGDGRLAGRIVKDPLPFNLTESQAPDEYLFQIIAEGGDALGRSGQMPPWGEELAGQEIQSLILFLNTLRKP